MHRKWLLLLLATAGVTLAASDSLWLGLRSRYLSLKTLSGTFEELICSDEAGTCQTFSGRFYIRVPGRYRLEVSEPVTQRIVCDSSTLWIYLPDEKRATASPAAGPAPVLAFLDPLLDPSASGVVETDSTGQRFVAVNAADSSSALADLRLALDKNGTRITGFSFTDGWSNHYSFTLSDQQWNPKLADKLFRFSPPKGVTVER